MNSIYVKIFIFLMFFTGLFQMKLLGISWDSFRVIQALHVVVSLAVMLFLIAPFIYGHIYKYYVIKKIKSVDGWLLFFMIIAITCSGVYLFFIGNRGGDIAGIISFTTHLYGSFFLILFFIWHILKAQKQNLSSALALLLFFTINPALTDAYTEFTLLRTDSADSKSGRYHNEDWTNSTKCKACHSEIFDQWSDSNHKHIAGSNPYYMVMEALAAEIEGEDFRKWCMGCHNPSALTTGLSKTTHAMSGNLLRDEIFETGTKTVVESFETKGNFRLEEGVSCVTCHRITEAEGKGNASYKVSLNREKYLFEDSVTILGDWFSQKLINSNPDVHKESYMKPLYKKSRYCGSCHDEFHPQNGIKIVSTLQEWKKSPFNNPNDKSKHKTCIDCHMTNLQNNKFSPYKGTSTDGGVIKDDVKVHYFAGSNHFLAGLKSKKHEEQTISLLKTSAKIDFDIKDGDLVVGVTNVGAGHHLPTGVADFRELWLDVTVRDKNKDVVFSSGKLKSDGNIEDGSMIFQKVFGDENAKPVGLLFWKYKTLISDTRIPSGERVLTTYKIDKNVLYPLSVSVKLNFRIYPQWVTDMVKKVFINLPNPPVIELIKVKKEFK